MGGVPEIFCQMLGTVLGLPKSHVQTRLQLCALPKASSQKYNGTSIEVPENSLLLIARFAFIFEVMRHFVAITAQ
jgi:hypothetical protein